MEKGQILDLTIEDMSQEGKGIGKADGFTVFVDGAVVCDKVRVQLRKVKKRYGFGELIEILEESPERIESFCARHGECGGCPYGQLSYAAQLALKEKQVRDKLERLGGVAAPLVRPIIAMEGEPSNYRNKATMAVSTGGLITEKGGIARPVHEPRVGFYGACSHEVADCSRCRLQSEPAMAAAEALRQFMIEDHITSYDPRWEKGLMRHMIVRTAAGTGEVMIILVINGKAIANAQKLVEMLDEAIYNVPVYEEGPLAGVEFNLESVVINVNKSKNLDGPILGEECITIAGKPTITEEVNGMKFEISPLSFYQVNREQMVKLYDKVLEYADLKGGETVLDLYCGVGTIGLFCAREMQRKEEQKGAEGTPESMRPGQVIGIESVKGAVLDANRNATINGIVNARYVCGKAEEELPKMMGMASAYGAEEGALAAEGGKEPALRITQADVAILDPPRAGCDERLLDAVVKAEPAKIVYVSCDPATLARDIKWLGEHGYEFKEATPCDMFPWTTHVETVCLMSHGEKRD
ncbi:MAG: 23S rRNA (uracil(1939)-C(5))-methyltransferase RlmD [Anaerovoracaceae bacterium]